jgi:hypothetical protein
MRSAILLDTHVLVWLLVDSPRLGAEARTLIQTRGAVRYSAASIWELEIKRGLGKITLPDAYLHAVTASGAQELPVTAEHAAHISSVQLPHRDPFDRLLLAQADVERLQFLTADQVLLGLGLRDTVDATL